MDISFPHHLPLPRPSTSSISIFYLLTHQHLTSHPPMGAAQSQKAAGKVVNAAVRTTPARFVPKQVDDSFKENETLAEQFAKVKHSLKGINKMQEQVSTTPQPFFENPTEAGSYPAPETVAPRWYVNTMMEMLDDKRKPRTILTGNLPAEWQRDHFEPYALVRNRIDDEDLDWVMQEGKGLPIEELVTHTKLERKTLESILAHVEMPRKQYRNYKGKLVKAMDDPNQYLTERKKKLEADRDHEMLKAIGYSEEDMEKEEQYRTTRSRGVKMLDDLGASLQARKRTDRVAQHNDMQLMLEERRIQQIEAGEFVPDKVELGESTDLFTSNSPNTPEHYRWRRPNPTARGVDLRMDEMDSAGPMEEDKHAKIMWAREQKAKIRYGRTITDGTDDHAKLLKQAISLTKLQKDGKKDKKKNDDGSGGEPDLAPGFGFDAKFKANELDEQTRQHFQKEVYTTDMEMKQSYHVPRPQPTLWADGAEQRKREREAAREAKAAAEDSGRSSRVRSSSGTSSHDPIEDQKIAQERMARPRGEGLGQLRQSTSLPPFTVNQIYERHFQGKPFGHADAGSRDVLSPTDVPPPEHPDFLGQRGTPPSRRLSHEKTALSGEEAVRKKAFDASDQGMPQKHSMTEEISSVTSDFLSSVKGGPLGPPGRK